MIYMKYKIMIAEFRLLLLGVAGVTSQAFAWPVLPPPLLRTSQTLEQLNIKKKEKTHSTIFYFYVNSLKLQTIN